MNIWNGNPYHSLDFHLKEMFGRKVYKLALDGGMTCPNRDGSVGHFLRTVHTCYPFLFSAPAFALV